MVYLNVANSRFHVRGGDDKRGGEGGGMYNIVGYTTYLPDESVKLGKQGKIKKRERIIRK